MRIAGVPLPRTKQVRIALSSIYGIGDTLARKILKDANVPESTRVWRLGHHQLDRLNAIIDREYVVEGELKRQVHQNIERLKAMRAYRGTRHRRGLPVRGQRTRSNARTRKGPRKNSISVIWADRRPE